MLSGSLRSEVISELKKVYDPDIGVNIYDLGLIYSVDVQDGRVKILMTFTSFVCPFADVILEEVKAKVGKIDSVNGVAVEITFDPPWDREMMTETGRLDAGLW